MYQKFYTQTKFTNGFSTSLFLTHNGRDSCSASRHTFVTPVHSVTFLCGNVFNVQMYERVWFITIFNELFVSKVSKFLLEISFTVCKPERAVTYNHKAKSYWSLGISIALRLCCHTSIYELYFMIWHFISVYFFGIYYVLVCYTHQ